MRNIEEEYTILNKMIKEDKIKFKFLNKSENLELLQFCINKKNNTLEFEFRDVMKEHIEELKILLEKI